MRPTLILACCLALAVSVSSATAGEPQATTQQAQTKKTTVMRAEGCDSGCACCHTCDKPTQRNRCLPFCDRHERHVYMRDQQGPDVVILDELEDAYLPVPFDHKGHARMAEMTKGCVVCHHYTPEGREHPACKTCHAVEVEGTDIRKPGLKGAYHRQCLNCHRDWIDETDCAKCHLLKAGQPAGASLATPTAEVLLGEMHPPITEPISEIYRAEYKKGAKSVVLFRHWEHVNNFDLGCVDCHHEESCARCHGEESDRKQARTVKEHHKPCLRCHERDMSEGTDKIAGRCKRCHWQPGEPKSKPFEHADTGWPLSRFHEGKGCRQCHRAVPYRKLDRNCAACHGDWSPETFDHTVTGQALDETHAEIDCTDCHVGGQFDRAPSCAECHDPDEGIGFPGKRPGPVAKPASTKAEGTD